MRRQRSPAAFCLLVPILCGLLAPLHAQGRTIRRTRHFTLECKFKDDLFADDAVEVLDRVFAVAEKAFGPTPKMLAAVRSRRLKVFVYGDRVAYEEAAQKHGKAAFAKWQGFADGRTRACHLVRADDSWWQRAEMDPANRHVIAHEAMHLLVMEFTAGRGMLLPMWVAEGIPLWTEGEVMIAGGWAKDRAADVEETAGVLAARQLFAAGRFPAVEDIVSGDWKTITEQEAYHPIRMLWTLLAERHADVVPKLLADVAATPGSAAVTRILRASLRGHLGEAAFDQLDAQLVELVKTRETTARKVIRPLPSDTTGKPGDPDFKPGSPAVRWLGSTTQRSYTIRAKVGIGAGDRGQADLLFGRRGDRWLRFSVVPGAGVFLLRRTDQGDTAGPWQVVEVQRDVPGLAAGETLTVQVAVAGNKVVFRLGARPVLEFDVGEPPAGKWGVGGPAGSRTRWEDLGIR